MVFIEPEMLKTSDWPQNLIPAGCTPVSQTDESGECTVKGFHDPKTGVLHIQEVIHTKETT